ncbi:protein hok [Cronobacter sakazakii E899]|nr:protein hok [Cronobacter sakazakii E899]
MVRQKEESPEGNFSINQRGPLMHRHHQRSLLPAVRQGEEGHETAAKHSVLVRINVCLTLLIFTFLTRNSLCELRLKDGQREFAAFLAYESGK